MKTSPWQVLGALFIIFLLCSCQGSSKKRKRSEPGAFTHSITSIYEEYERLDKLCNQIQVQQTEPGSQAGQKTQLRQMRLDVMHLQTQLKTNILKDRSFGQELLKTGFDAAMVVQLAERIEKLYSNACLEPAYEQAL